MKKNQSLLKKVYNLAIANYFLTIILAILIVVGSIIVYKKATTKDHIVYVKVKVSQGYWWANTLRPSMWLIKALQKGDADSSLSGKPNAIIQDVTYYPVANYTQYVDQYDLYLTVKLRVNKNDKTNKYSYNRAAITVGSPIDFEFKNAQITATVIGMSEKPYEDVYVDKIVVLTKKFVNPSEYEIIKTGDVYYDGREQVVEILEKEAVDAYELYSGVDNNYPITAERLVNITIKAKMRLHERGDALFFGEEVQIINGKKINLETSSYILDQYLITSVE